MKSNPTRQAMQAIFDSAGRAKKGGQKGLNGEWYRGGSFLPSTRLPKGHTVSRSSGSGMRLIEPGVKELPPKPDAVPIFQNFMQFMAVEGGKAVIQDRPDAAVAAYVDDNIEAGRLMIAAAVKAYNKGMRWVADMDALKRQAEEVIDAE